MFKASQLWATRVSWKSTGVIIHSLMCSCSCHRWLRPRDTVQQNTYAVLQWKEHIARAATPLPRSFQNLWKSESLQREKREKSSLGTANVELLSMLVLMSPDLLKAGKKVDWKDLTVSTVQVKFFDQVYFESTKSLLSQQKIKEFLRTKAVILQEEIQWTIWEMMTSPWTSEAALELFFTFRWLNLPFNIRNTSLFTLIHWKTSFNFRI